MFDCSRIGKIFSCQHLNLDLSQQDLQIENQSAENAFMAKIHLIFAEYNCKIAFSCIYHFIVEILDYIKPHDSFRDIKNQFCIQILHLGVKKNKFSEKSKKINFG